MGLTDIFSDAISYPFSNITNFLIVGVLAVLASLSSILSSLGVQSSIILVLALIIGFIFTLIFSGYGVSVIKRTIEGSNDFPDIDLMANLIDGIKALIISIVYMIIPTIIAFALAAIFGVIGAGIDHIIATMGIASIIIFLVFVLFGIFEVIALAKFADTGSIGAAINIGEVFGDVTRIGILKIIIFIIILMILAFVVMFIIGVLALIPIIGIIIATLLAGAFLALFSNRALGLLYAGA